jgi:hypothetical protein
MHGIFLQPCLNFFRTGTLWLWIITVPLLSHAQDPVRSAKLSPLLASALEHVKPEAVLTLRVYLKPEVTDDSLALAAFSARQVPSSGKYRVVDIRTTGAELRSRILPSRYVLFVEQARTPRPELFVGSMDLSLNGVRRAQSVFPNITGDAQVVSVKEERPDSNDLDIRGRVLPSPVASSRVDGHATLMSTIVAGAGNSWILGRGVAPRALISPSDFANLLPDPVPYYTSNDIRVQNHSYGVDVESFYGADAAAYDATAIQIPSLLHVFSAGNRGNAQANTGPYRGLAGFANLTGSFKMSKNSLAVGAIDSFSRVEVLSSRGPAHDGRVKPELVAFGEDGSSGAAALVSGTATLLQQAYQRRSGTPAPNALLRNVLINTATDLGTPSVDYVYGYGSLDAHAALQVIQQGTYAGGTVSSLATAVHTIDVPPGIARLKLTLTWNDPAATPNAEQALLHDLDVHISAPSGQTWMPWVLSPFPHPDSLRRPAIRGRDSLNNVEQVTIDLPEAGEYAVTVRSGTLAAAQPYFLSWQIVPLDSFEWLFPVREDYLQPGTTATLRWKTPIRDGVAIEYSLDSGRSWTMAIPAPDLAAGAARWTVPDHRGIFLLRARSSHTEYRTDTIVVSSLLQPVVGFFCTDSAYLSWPSIPGATRYRLLRMGERYLSTALETQDSFALVARTDYPGDLVAVEPLFGGQDGLPSYTFNLSTQGVGCYLRSFRAEADNQAARLFLSLGTLFRIRAVVLEKWSSGQFVPLAIRERPDSLAYEFRDASLIAGTNRYRVRIVLEDGRNLFSDQEDVFFGGPAGFRLYPSLLRSGETLNLYLADLPDEAYVQVIDLQGRILWQSVIDAIPAPVPTTNLGAGMYIIRIVENGKQVHTGRFLVLQ